MDRLRRSLQFRGRATRLEYWRFQLIMVALSGLDILLTMFAIRVVGPPGGIVLVPMGLAIAISVALSVRRLHDRNRSGWWLLVFWLLPAALNELYDRLPHPARGLTLAMLVVYLGILGFSIWGWLEIAFLRGTRGDNRFGEDAQSPVGPVFA